MTIGVYIPTLGRPQALQRVSDSVRAAATLPYTLVFIVELGDTASLTAARATGTLVLENTHEPCFAGALQTAYDLTDDEFFLAGNDDFGFQPGWDSAAVTAMSDADVVGIHDRYAGTDATMFIRRSYIKEQGGVIDMPPGRVYYPYQHNCCDTEFRETAAKRGRFKRCPESVISHEHVCFGKAENDDTYRKGIATWEQDLQTFNERRHLWA